MAEGMRLLQEAKGLKEGTEYSYTAFEPSMATAIQARTVVGTTKQIDLLGRVVELTELTNILSMPGMGEISSKSYVDRDFKLQKDIMPIMGMSIETIEALAERLDPAQTLLYIPGWRRAGYDRDYPTYDEPVDALEPFVTRAHELGYRVMLHVNYFGCDPLNHIVRSKNLREIGRGERDVCNSPLRRYHRLRRDDQDENDGHRQGRDNQERDQGIRLRDRELKGWFIPCVSGFLMARRSCSHVVHMLASMASSPRCEGRR